MPNYYNDSIEQLYQAIASIQSAEECRAFLEDLCTIKEILDMAQRFETAILLDQGYSYQKISEKVGISSATIGRVSRALTYGSNGYRKAIDRMGKGEEKDGDQ